MDLHTHYPFSLLKYGLLETYPSLPANIKTDVAIIGAGITGALMAWHLEQAGIDCAVFDKRHVATGSTAASTSLIQYEIDTPLYKLVDMVGYKNAVTSYLLCLEAIGKLKHICDKVGSGENFHKKNSLQYASAKKDIAGLEKEFELRKLHGFNVDLLEESEIKKDYHFKSHAALRSHEAAQVDAYRLTHDIFRNLKKKNLRVFDHTAITAVKHEKRKIILTTDEGFKVSCKQLVIACGYESEKFVGKKFEDLRCTFALASEPLEKKELWKDSCLIWETADPYLYIRTTSDGRVLVGGKDTGYQSIRKQIALLPAKTKALQKSFEKLFPHITIKKDFQWAGAFASTRDGLPYIGALPNFPNTYFGLGYGGNGITFSLIAAEMICKAIMGKPHADMELFSFNRK